MEIMAFVEKHMNEKTPLFYLYAFFTMAATFIIIVHTPFSNKMPPWGEHLIWRILWVGSQMLIIYIWFYYAPIVRKDFMRLKGAFPGKGYRALYISLRRWLYQFQLKGSGKNGIFKVIYTVLWSIFFLSSVIFLMGYLDPMNDPLTPEGTILYFFLITVVITLNFSSYYICIMFVYFLMRLYREAGRNGLEYVEELPSVTHGFQLLLNIANTIYLYFLMDSFLSTVSFFALWKLTPKEGLTGEHYWMFVRPDFLYLVLFLIICGLGTWVFIVLVSRAYLRRLHHEWVYQSSLALRKTYRTASGGPKEQAVIDKERLYQDKISISGWDMLISLAALAANLFTAWSIFAGII